MMSRIKVLLLATLLFTISACSGPPNRSGDAAQLPQDVPAEAPATTPPTAQPTLAPPAQPAAESTPTAGPQPEPAGDVVTFSVEGGIAAFCDRLRIDAGGNYTLSICGQPDVAGALDEPDRVSLQTWRENLAAFQLTFEDNPGGPDNMVRALTFNGQGQIEADQNQQQVIFDWASGLNLRLRPQQAEAPPTPQPAPATAGGVCPDIARPALIMANLDNANLLTLVNPNSQATCELTLTQTPVGRIVAAADNLYFPVFDPEAKTTTIWQRLADGVERPLGFTSLSSEVQGPSDFIVSDDGAKIAWTQTIINFETDPPVYRNNLWVANVDGSFQVTLIDAVENSDSRFVGLARFSANAGTLYYALQPDIGGPVFSGRFDTLYSAPTGGGSAQLLYACPPENPVCVGGLSPDGSLITVVQPQAAAIQLLNREGSLLNTLALPATDYIERTAFAPNGNLAYVTAKLAQASQDDPPLPNPGYISFIAPPYAGQPQTLVSNNNVGTLRGWLDDNRLVIGTIDAAGNVGSSIVTLDGQITDLLPDTEYVTIGVWR